MKVSARTIGARCRLFLYRKMVLYCIYFRSSRALLEFAEVGQYAVNCSRPLEKQTRRLNSRISMFSSEWCVNASLLIVCHIGIFLLVTSWNINKAFTTTAFKKSSKANCLYHFIVFLNGQQYALLWSERSMAVFPILYSTTIFGLQQNHLFVFIFTISLEFFLERTKTLLLFFHFKTIISLLFSFAITSPRFNLVVVISFSIPIKCIFFFISLFAKSTLLYYLSVHMVWPLWNTPYINPSRYLMMLYFVWPELFAYRHGNYKCVHNFYVMRVLSIPSIKSV